MLEFAYDALSIGINVFWNRIDFRLTIDLNVIFENSFSIKHSIQGQQIQLLKIFRYDVYIVVTIIFYVQVYINLLYTVSMTLLLCKIYWKT